MTELPASLAERYRLASKLAAGAQSEAYLAVDQLRGEQVVIKKVLPGALEGLRREYRLLSALRHPRARDASCGARDRPGPAAAPVLVQPGPLADPSVGGQGSAGRLSASA